MSYWNDEQDLNKLGNGYLVITHYIFMYRKSRLHHHHHLERHHPSKAYEHND